MIHEGRFAGKIAVVTGAAQGIGEAVARGIAREQSRLALVDCAEFVGEVRDELAAEGCDVVSYLADLEQYQDCLDVMTRAHGHFGRIDILVNNVGSTICVKPYDSYDEKQIEAEIGVRSFRRCGAAGGAALHDLAGRRRHRQRLLGGDAQP